MKNTNKSKIYPQNPEVCLRCFRTSKRRERGGELQQTPLSPALHQTGALAVLKEGKAEQTRDSFQVLPDSPFKGRTQAGKNTCRYKHTNTNTNTQRQRQTHTRIKTHKDKHTKKQGKAEQTPFKCCQIYPSKGKAEHM